MKLAEIAAAIGARLEGDGALEIDSLEPLDRAGPRDLAFLAHPRYASQLATTHAAAVIVADDGPRPPGAALRTPEPYLAFARALALFERRLLPPPGIDPSAQVASDARIGEGARIGPRAVIGAGVRLGARAVIHPGVVLYPEVEIGDDFEAHANAIIRERVRIGHRVRIGPGAVIGGEGFGFLPLPQGGVFRLAQIGRVEIGDDVEVGANATVDRATIGVTSIERGAKLDNLVMIAHGCRVGEEALIAAQTGLAGSTQVGARAQLGGQVGSAGHLRIGAGARIAAQSGIAADVPDRAEFGGYPAMEAALWRRVVAAARRLPELLRRVRRLERAIEARRAGGG